MDPDPDSNEMLVLDPYPDSMNPDPFHNTVFLGMDFNIIFASITLQVQDGSDKFKT